MSTARQIIYNIKSILLGGLITDDSKITDRQVGFVVDAIRATLIRQAYDKGQSLSDNHIQHIQCLDVEQVDSSFDLTVPLGCSLFRTKQKIPRVIETKFKDLLTIVSPSEFGNLGYDLVPFGRVPYVLSTRFKSPIAVLYNQYIYLIASSYVEKINVSGVFEQPSDISMFISCDGSPCYTWDDAYPLSSHLIDILTRMAIQELSPETVAPIDKTNDGNQTLENQGNGQHK